MENESNKITAVEWVIKELKNKDYLGTFCTADAWEEEEKEMRLIIEQAKAMEREQIMEAHYAPKYGCFSEQYYDQTYGGNK